jgi:hypothetical protein
MEAHYGIALGGFSHNKAAFPSGFISPPIRLDCWETANLLQLMSVCGDHECPRVQSLKGERIEDVFIVFPRRQLTLIVDYLIN